VPFQATHWPSSPTDNFSGSSGKSTLARMINGLIEPTTGQVTVVSVATLYGTLSPH